MARYNTKRCACGTVTSVWTTTWIGTALDAVRGLCEVYATESGTAVLVDNGRAIVHCRACGARRYAAPVRGHYSATIRCDGRCEGATGHQCECQCGGRNHGRAAAM